MKGDKEVQKYQIRQGGGSSYVFQNIVPGSYQVKATHPSWSFSKVRKYIYHCVFLFVVWVRSLNENTYRIKQTYKYIGEVPLLLRI